MSMRRLLQQVMSGELGAKHDPWMIRLLTRPPVSRLTCVLIVASFVMIIGLIDYASGTTFSLQVFYLAPIALAVAWLGISAALVAAICALMVRLGGDYLQHARYIHRPNLIWNTLSFLATYMIVAWILQSFIMLHRKLEERVNARTAALALEVLAREQLQQELIELSERERLTIGNDLHDGLGQHLTAMAFAAEVLTHQLASQDILAANTAREIVRLAEEGILQSRQLARGLLLTVIEPAGLSRELEELASSVQRQTGVRCHYEAHQPPLVGDSSTASHLYRIAQEAVRNAIRHAQPTAVNLSLKGEPPAIVLAISDNGTGLPQIANQEAGVGLRVMAHRARLIDGVFTIESAPGKGTRILCRVPLPITSVPVL